MSNSYLPVTIWGGLFIGTGSYLMYFIYKHGNKSPNVSDVIGISSLVVFYNLVARQLGKSIAALM